jgi:hypothetical protein
MNASQGQTRRCAIRLAAACCLALACDAVPAQGVGPQALTALYAARVTPALDVPLEEQSRYARLAQVALDRAQSDLSRPQYVLVVDRDPWVQAALLYWRSEYGQWRWIGASPVSTGRPGEFDHFQTPLGVFDHTPANPDYRAEGTPNENGILGYGAAGMRVFDFGWQRAPKGWGDGAVIDMRLQMHATDPDALEQRLGSAQSKGCVRIPATLDALLDRFGVLDAAYEERASAGQSPGVLRADREPVEQPGRYLVVVDSARSSRADWSPEPYIPHVRRSPAVPGR